jgi:hypothetical protein
MARPQFGFYPGKFKIKVLFKEDQLLFGPFYKLGQIFTIRALLCFKKKL